MKYLISLIFISISLNSQAFWGRSAVEATLKFDGKIKVSNQLTAFEVEESIESQIEHLLGTFQSKSFLKKFKFKGNLGDDRKVYDIQRVPLNKDQDIIQYKFKGNSVFDKKAFGRKKYISLPLKLPFSLDEIYELGLVGDINKCTDSHYNSEGDFFYFWDPDLKGCPLKGNRKDVLRIKGKLIKRKSTRRSYPFYKKLFGNNGNGRDLKIDVFFGFIEDKPPKNLTDYLKQVAMTTDPNSTIDGVDDYIFAAYEVGEFLENKGFSFKQKETGARVKMKFKFINPETKKEDSVDTFIRTGKLFGYVPRKELKTLKRKGLKISGKISNSQGDFISELRTYTKTFSSGKKVTVNIHITSTDVKLNESEGQNYFKRNWKKALKNSDIIEYEGHSGLGGNLDFDILYGNEQIMNPNKYQVIFINGCSSYPYFRQMFYDQKRNRKNLDLILSGLSVYTDDGASNSMAFLSSFINPDIKRKRSFQSILSRIERSNRKENGSYLTAVIGDEDKLNK